VDNGQAKLTYTYGSTGRIASETSDISALVPGLDPQTVGYAYDELGRQANLSYPDRTKVTSGYDARGRLTTIDNDNHGRALAEYSYDQFGRPAKLTRDNGIVTSYTYNMTGQLTDIVHVQGKEVFAAAHYTLDVDGRRTVQIREDNVTETYGYDATSQLTSVDYGAVGPTADRASSESFSYDSVGNRTQALSTFSAQLSMTGYTTNALNQYTKVAGTAFAYDANGNLLDDGNQTYRYDAQNRLISVESSLSSTSLMSSTSSAPVRADFFYDARNRCILRKYYTKGSQGQWVLDDASSRALTYDAGWNLLSERKLNGDQAGEYIHGLRTDEILSAQLGSQTVYPLADGLGSTVALTDDKGKVTERVRYDAFGTPHVLSKDYRPLSTGSAYRFLFTGREWIAQFELCDHRNRYYSPSLGRWLATDPIKFQGGIDLYEYVTNSPTNYGDEYGLACCTSAQKAALQNAYDNKVTALTTDWSQNDTSAEQAANAQRKVFSDAYDAATKDADTAAQWGISGCNVTWAGDDGFDTLMRFSCIKGYQAAADLTKASLDVQYAATITATTVAEASVRAALLAAFEASKTAAYMEMKNSCDNW
jgi:RHS repeat-associated protein